VILLVTAFCNFIVNFANFGVKYFGGWEIVVINFVVLH